MHKLEQYYSGDENWNNFVELYDEFWINNDKQKALLSKVNNHLDIAKVIYGKKGKHSLLAVEKKIPALDNLSMIDCVNNPELLPRLKECLLRMP